MHCRVSQPPAPRDVDRRLRVLIRRWRALGLWCPKAARAVRVLCFFSLFLALAPLAIGW